jgi:hypothetical protein
MSSLNRGPSIDVSYQVSVHLAKTISEEKIFNKSANQKQELPLATMFVNGSGCFLPSFSSFERGVSEEEIKM